MIKFDEAKRMIEHALRPLRSKVNALVVRGVINAVNNAAKMQTLKVLWMGDASEPVEFMQPGGVRHYPAKGAEVLMFRTPQGIQFAVGGSDRSLRGLPDLSEGETVIYGFIPTDGGEGGPSNAGIDAMYMLLGADGIARFESFSSVHFMGDTYSVSRDDRVQAEFARVKTELDKIKADLTTIKSHKHAVTTTGSASTQSGTTSVATSLSYIPTVSPASPGFTKSFALKTGI